MSDFRLRQVHLDFHTSPLIPGIGERFNKEEWQNALKSGHVNSITVFSKCHHGYSYHPTKVNEMHPGLEFDLLGAQLEACREIGVRAPVYISAGYDEKDAVAHPEWQVKKLYDYDKQPDYSVARYHHMCLNTPYLDKLLAEVDEVMVNYNPCEIFLDIVGETTCWCDKCRSDMEKEGIDWHNEDEVKKFGRRIYRHYLDEVYRVVKGRNPETTIFQNGGHIQRGRPDLIDTIEELELESLPTGGWGYDHFPMSAAYARTTGKNFLGMTGKFHGSWGEFGGFKHPNALRYEAALSLACGAGCSVGDQMHPEGKLNESTYALIGKAYAETERKEPWCIGAKYIPDIAVLSAEAISGGCDESNKADTGANRILLETKRLYDYIDTFADFEKYKLIILPDLWRIDDALKAKLDAFLENGGKLLLSGVSGLGADNKFRFDTGVEFMGENEFSPTYCIPAYEAVNGKTEYLMRSASYRAENIDADVIAYGQNPYFNRTPEHFCSHQHAPNDRSLTYPAAFIKGNIGYAGWKIFTGYAETGEYHIKELADKMIRTLMNDDFTVSCTLPDRGIITLMQQENRKTVHLLYAHTSVRGRNTEVIEDIVPIRDVEVTVKTDKPSKVILVPENIPVDYDYKDGRVCFTVPEVNLHQMISIEY